MATQTRTMAPPAMMPARSSGNIITQILRVFIHPRAFFRNMPSGSSWLLAAALVLAMTGYAATQMQAEAETTVGNVLPITTGFDPSTMQAPANGENSSGDQATGGFTPGAMQMPSGAETTGDGQAAGGFDLEALNDRAQASGIEIPGLTGNTADVEAAAPESTLTIALLAMSVQILLWGGQAAVLSLVPMLGGHAPKFGRGLQIAVWASLPLALMLVLRAVSFATGGEGGSLGVSALLTQWDGFASLPELAQSVVTVFAANLTLFWLWSLVLMYFGARYALGGGRLAAALVIAMWIVGSTVGTALAGGIPTTSIPVTVEAVAEEDSDTASDGNNTLPQGMNNFSFGGTDGGAIQIMPGGDGATFSARPMPSFGGQTGGGG